MTSRRSLPHITPASLLLLSVHFSFRNLHSPVDFFFRDAPTENKQRLSCCDYDGVFAHGPAFDHERAAWLEEEALRRAPSL